MQMVKIAALLTCHNRRETTLACLRALYNCNRPPDVLLANILVDDGSTDGTAQMVRERFPGVEVLEGDGHLYWNGGMHRAFAHALRKGFDAYLWLNDDTFLDPEALTTLVNAWRDTRLAPAGRAILIGSTRDPGSGVMTYGGFGVGGRWRPLRFRPVIPCDVAQVCATMNGNCVLIPDVVARELGNLDPVFAHAMGDIDYGLRARRQGIPLWVVPGFIGTCRSHAGDQTRHEQRLPFRVRWQKVVGRKRLPPRSWLVLVRRHGGILWPLQWISPYVKVLLGWH